MIGTLLNDRYRLEEQIGSGGMSTVYRAFDPTLERWVAIKLMHRDISSDSDKLERFRREARAVARLSHPHVVTVIDFGEDDGTPYIVLEFIEGETLKERIQRMGRLSVAESVAYAIEVGRALSAAHAERLVHRDVKPQNVLIDQEGRAKVTDFGIARSLEVEGLTSPGRVLGTTDYVAPEQACGQGATEQSDVYSLGIVLFEMLTGEVPFTADSQVAVARKHVREPLPDVQRLRPEVSSALAAVVDRATAKQTANRYPTAEDMVRDLEQVLAIEVARTGQAGGEATAVLRALPGDTAEFVPFRLRSPRRFILMLLVLGLLGAGAVVYLAGRTETGPGAAVTPKAGLTRVQVAGGAAHDYDPEGDGREHEIADQNAIDGIRPTEWDTETYEGGLQGAGKDGVGLYVDAGSPVAAKRLDLVTTRPGWTAAIYAANGSEAPEDIAGWTKISRDTTVEQDERIPLRTGGTRFRLYLVWITALPQGAEGGDKAAISELTLRR
ncbi:MAG: protein kinase [Actinomycetota bacterium]|nr:protein kinase [Actinomycetota bacterium]